MCWLLEATARGDARETAGGRLLRARLKIGRSRTPRAMSCLTQLPARPGRAVDLVAGFAAGPRAPRAGRCAEGERVPVVRRSPRSRAARETTSARARHMR